MGDQTAHKTDSVTTDSNAVFRIAVFGGLGLENDLFLRLRDLYVSGPSQVKSLIEDTANCLSQAVQRVFTDPTVDAKTVAAARMAFPGGLEIVKWYFPFKFQVCLRIVFVQAERLHSCAKF